jgi:ParB family chromosome partitioning protein
MPGPRGPNQHEELIMTTDTQQTQFRFIGARHLSLSPLNVRKTAVATGIEQLADLINAEGVLQNLDVYEFPQGEGKKKTTHAVVAGGRRWRALQLLIKQKRIKPDFAVPCLIVSHERAVQISLAENSGRQPMHPADEFEAFRLLVDSGQPVEDVAARFSVTPLVVQRRLKLANVCPTFIALYREGEITLEHLMTFAVTDDHEKQRQVWDSLKPYDRHPDSLREALTVSDIALREPLARFVGVKAYQKAGGFVRRDLFADEDEGAMLDGDLVRKLATEKLEKYAAQLKGEGLAWVDVHLQMDYAARAAYGRVRTILREPTEQEKAQLVALDTQKKEIEAQMAEAEEDEGRLADLSDEEARLDSEIERLHEQRGIPDPEQQAIAGASVSVGPDGKVRIDRNLLKPEDAERFGRAQKAQERAAAAKAPRVHSATLVRRLTANRTLALQATLARRPEIALVALTHRLILRSFGAGYARDSALQIEADMSTLQVHAKDLAGSKAQSAMETMAEQLRAGLPEDPDALFAWLLVQPQAQVLSLLAYCVATTLNGVQSDECVSPTDALARAAGLDMREWWTPSVDNYLGSIPKARILAVVTEAVSGNAAAPLAKLKKAAITKAAEQQLVGTGWLPTILRTDRA